MQAREHTRQLVRVGREERVHGHRHVERVAEPAQVGQVGAVQAEVLVT
jgi:hypothetical protein